MNKKILTAAAIAAAASMSFGFVTWFGDESVYQIDTELDAGTGTAGYWFIYGDDSDGGASSITWPVPAGNDYSDDALDPIIDHCSGVCGEFSLNKGTLTYNPFVGIGFNIAGEDDGGTPTAADASAMGGVCIAYSVDVGASLEMGLGDAVDASLGYDNPFVTIPKAPTGATKEFAWSKFAQAGWGTGEITGEAASAKLVSLKFKIQDKTGTAGKFNIQSIGAMGGGCKLSGAAPAPGAIGDKALQASLKAQLSGRTLSFGKTVAKAELVNLQGQVVMAASSVKSMDLSKLQAGVYMVRAMGLSQQIVLK